MPLLVGAIVIAVVGGFALGGPSLGVGLGGLVLVALVVVAFRSRPREPIAGSPTGEANVLALALAPIDDPATANRVATLAEADPDSDLLVLAPARGSTVRRWLSDEGPARLDAQRNLTISLATLATAGCEAEGRVADDDPILAVEDSVALYGASRIIFVVPAGGFEEEVAEISDRLDRPVHRVEVSVEASSI